MTSSTSAAGSPRPGARSSPSSGGYRRRAQRAAAPPVKPAGRRRSSAWPRSARSAPIVRLAPASASPARAAACAPPGSAWRSRCPPSTRTRCSRACRTRRPRRRSPRSPVRRPRPSPGAWPVGCPTPWSSAAHLMLHVDGELVGKPHDAATYCTRWAAMAGGTGALVTGHAVLRLARRRAQSMVSPRGTPCPRPVRPPGPRGVATYVATGEPLAVAGAFTLDGLGGWFARRHRRRPVLIPASPAP